MGLVSLKLSLAGVSLAIVSECGLPKCLKATNRGKSLVMCAGSMSPL